MELKGTVLNVVDFGAFVDIGLKDSGLVHISQLANRYIKSPHDVVSVGDVVTAWVMGVDQRAEAGLADDGQAGHRASPGRPRRRRRRSRRRRAARAASRGGGERRGGGAGAGRPPRREGVGRRAVGTAAGPVRRRGDPRGGPSRPAGRGRGGPGPAAAGRTRRRLGPRRPRPGGGRAAVRPVRAPPGPASPGPPAKPAPPPPPLSKDALTGSVPLRTFGQLKQLWQARDRRRAPARVRTRRVPPGTRGATAGHARTRTRARTRAAGRGRGGLSGWTTGSPLRGPRRGRR